MFHDAEILDLVDTELLREPRRAAWHGYAG
jgi:hypothetical protein